MATPDPHDPKIHHLYDSPSTRGPGGPYDGGMLEVRVKHLEDGMSEVKTDLKDIRDRVARIEGEISRLPGYGGLLAITGIIIAAVGLMLRFMPPAG